MTSKRLISSKRFRFIVSLLLLLHLLALFLPPLSFQSRGPLGQSPSVASLLRPLEGYGQFLYMNRGYAFFAPDPGPSHLIQVAITDEAGNRQEVMYPDRTQQRPRLMYHRHFMLTEFLFEIYQPPPPSVEIAALDASEAEYWQRSRARYEYFRRSLVQHLESVHPGREIAIRRIEHLIPDLLSFRERPISLTVEDSYRVMLDQPIELSEPTGLEVAEPLPEAIPAPFGAARLRQEAAEASEASEADAKSRPAGETEPSQEASSLDSESARGSDS